MTKIKEGIGKKLWCILLALALVVTMMPLTGGTAYAEEITKAKTPEAKDGSVYANGTHIYIEKGNISGTTSIYYLDGTTKKPVITDTDLSDYEIYGGFDGADYSGDTYITMSGGKVAHIYGCGRDSSSSTQASSGDVGNVNIEVTGGNITGFLAPATNTRVNGNVKITITGGNIANVYGCPTIIKNIAGLDSKVTGNVDIYITGGTVNYVYGGDEQHIVGKTVSAIVTVSVEFINTDGTGNDKYHFNNLLYLDGSEFKCKGEVTIPSDLTLQVANGQTLNISAGNLTNNGTIENSGTMNVNGTYSSSGKIINKGTLNVNDTYTNNGTIIADSGTTNLYAPVLGNKITGSGTVNCYAAYIADISKVEGISAKINGNTYNVKDAYNLYNGNLYIWLPSGNAEVTVKGTKYYGVTVEKTQTELKTDYVKVTDISGIPEEISANSNITLSAILTPSENTTFTPSVAYELIDNGTTASGASLRGDKLYAAGPGKVCIKVTASDSYTSISKTFEITVKHIPVTGLNPKMPENIYVNTRVTLPTVSPENASYKDITWSFVEGQSDGASISNGVLTATKAGTFTIRAEVENGRGYQTAYTEDFTVNVKVVDGKDGLDIGLGSVTISKNADGSLKVEYSGFGDKGYKNYAASDFIVIKGTTTKNRVIVKSGSPNIVLSDVSIKTLENSDSPFVICSGATAKLTLSGINELISSDWTKAGINVPKGATVIIDGTGELTAKANAEGGTSGAGIGGGRKQAGGAITIKGGTVKAGSTGRGAGIGGGNEADGGEVTIEGGTVTATSSSGAGIGGGNNAVGGEITIEGGTVTAKSSSGAGIGGGYKAAGGEITIEGGTVTATSYDGAGIGGGKEQAGGTITIKGGTVTATSTAFGAGIGGGKQGAGGSVAIEGGTVIATGGANGGAGIGGGVKANGGNVKITGGNVKAIKYFTNAEAIGTGGNGNLLSGTLTDANGASVSLRTLTLSELMTSACVTAIGGSSYGIKDVTTLDTNMLYFYLPSDASISSITTGGNTYICKDSSDTYYTTHKYDKIKCDGICTRCEAECEHTNETGSTCNICGKTLHIHRLEYTASGNAITETCTNGCEHSETATLQLKNDVDLIYTASEIQPLEVKYSDGWQGGALTVSYTNNTNVGTATGTISKDNAIARQTFEITNGTMTGITATAYSAAYDGQPHSISVTNAPNDAKLTYSTDGETYTETKPTYTNAGTYTVYYKVEKDNYNTVTDSAKVTILQATNTWKEQPSIVGWTYGDTAKTAKEGVSEFGTDVKVEYKLADAGDTEYSETVPTEAGSYKVRFSVEGNANYTALSTEKTFEIAKATIKDVSITQDGTLEYNGEYQRATVKTEVTAKGNQEVTFTYSASEEGDYSNEIPEFKEAGEYTVYCKVSAPNHNITTTDFKVKIDEKKVSVPTIASKAYTGGTQTADITDNANYSIEANNGGTNVGSYDVILKLKDSQNYKWNSTENVGNSITLKFEITQATNEWTTAPSIASWTYGQTASVPQYAAKFGDVIKISYSGKTGNGTEYTDSTKMPTEIGSYTATFTVEGTDNYSELTKEVSFSIKQKSSGGAIAPSVPTTDEVVSDKTAGTTTSDTEIKLEEKTDADGNKETTANVTVSDKNQKEIIDEAKKNDSKEIILDVSKDAVNESTGESGNSGNNPNGENTSGSADNASNVSKVDVKLDKDFVESIVKDTDADLTIKTPFGDKTYTQEELKKIIEETNGNTITLTVTKAEFENAQAETTAKAKELVGKIKLTARSSKTAKGNIKVTLKVNKEGTTAIKNLKNLGYTVKYRYYRSTKKASKYVGKITKTTKTFTNTKGKKGKKYYYKARVQVYNANGKLVAQTALKQCKYASRIW